MFTGIIEEIGKVKALRTSPGAFAVTIACENVTSGLRPGDSVSVNGVCLTAADISPGFFRADVMPETLKRSNLGALQAGSVVNLERALPADGRFGGHIVSGHIDGTGSVADIVRDGNAVRYVIEAPYAITRFIVEKGSVALDGVSLTVVEVSDASFSVSVIPHTMTGTILTYKKKGDIINIENDIIAKYVHKLLAGQSLSERGRGNGHKDKITMELLTRFGF